MTTVRFEHSELTRTIIGCFYRVYAEFKRKAFSNTRKGSLSWIRPSPDSAK